MIMTFLVAGLVAEAPPLTAALLATVRAVGAVPPAPATPPRLKARKARPPAHRATANLASYVSDDDYPPIAIRNGVQGVVGFRLAVDPAGLVESCEVTASSGSADLDQATCRIMQARPHFTPATDRKGRAVPDIVESRLNWVLPEEEETGPPSAGPNLASYVSNADYPPEAIRNGEEGTVGFVLDVTPEGIVGACNVVAPSGSTLLDARTCEIMSARARFTPARDSNGTPVADHIRARIRWVLPVEPEAVEPK